MPTNKRKRLTLKSPPKPNTVEEWMDKKTFKSVRRADIKLQKERSTRSKEALKKQRAILKAFVRTTVYKIILLNFEDWDGEFPFDRCSGCDGLEWGFLKMPWDSANHKKLDLATIRRLNEEYFNPSNTLDRFFVEKNKDKKKAA